MTTVLNKYVLKEDEAAHLHEIVDWAVGLNLEVGQLVYSHGVTFQVLAAHTTTAPDEPSVINYTGSFAINETPSGTMNGTNPTFTLAHTPSSVIMLFYNGTLLKVTEDYTITGTTITMDATKIPSAGESLLAFYPY